MLNYKINNGYSSLKKNFDLLYFKELVSTSSLVIYFNCNKVSNKYLYSLKNEILKQAVAEKIEKGAHYNDIKKKNYFQNYQ